MIGITYLRHPRLELGYPEMIRVDLPKVGFEAVKLK
jgi:hypothetical protein